MSTISFRVVSFAAVCLLAVGVSLGCESDRPAGEDGADTDIDCTDQLRVVPRDGSTIGIDDPWLTVSGNLDYAGISHPEPDEIFFQTAAGDAHPVHDRATRDAASHVGVNPAALVEGTTYRWRVDGGPEVSFSVSENAESDESYSTDPSGETEPGTSRPELVDGPVEVSMELAAHEGFPVMFREWLISFPAAVDEATEPENMRYILSFAPGEMDATERVLVTPRIEDIGDERIEVRLGGGPEECHHAEPSVPVTAETQVEVRAVDLSGNTSSSTAVGAFEGLSEQQLADAHGELNRVIDSLEEDDGGSETEAESGCSSGAVSPTVAGVVCVLLALVVARRRRAGILPVFGAVLLVGAVGCGEEHGGESVLVNQQEDAGVVDDAGQEDTDHADVGIYDAAPDCDDGLQACSGDCVDLMTDEEHCGACGHQCDDDYACEAGTCQLQCGDEDTACEGECVDTMTDDDHCGSCGSECDDGFACEEGGCQLQCSDGLDACYEECVDLSVDSDHCGECGYACDGDGFCHDGDCLSCDGEESWPESWLDFAEETVQLVNEVRTSGVECGGVPMDPVEPLEIDATLEEASRCHSQDMGLNMDDYISHTGTDGSQPHERAQQAGYPSSQVGENAAAGQFTPEDVVDGWIESDGHCENMMNGTYEDVGVGYIYVPESTYRHYWTKKLGRK